MNIKEWKQFSNAVDKFNCFKEMIGFLKFGFDFRIKKTQENFREWKAGKLNLK